MHLDDVQAIAELDVHDMLERISELPQQCRAAWQESQGVSFPGQYGEIDQVVVVGMGGSAIGGALMHDLIADQANVPVSVVRGYVLPAFAAGPHTLVAACSYSGNTEETLACFQQALDRDASVVAITTGGKLAHLARDADVPVVQFDYQSQPRAALGYSFILLLGVAHQLGLIPDYTDDVAEAVAVMEAWQAGIDPSVPTAANEAKALADQIVGSLPVVYGAGFLGATANRWKTQFNENAKSWAFFEILPELNHNAVVGLSIPAVASEHSFVVMLRSPLDRTRLARRWDVTSELLKRQGVAAQEVWGRGKSKLAQMLSLVHFGDYVSFYLAILNEVDPTPVENIAFLKRRLAELGSIVD